jgi:hypothetical protein
VGVQFTIDVKQRLVITTFIGENSLEEIIGVASLIHAHPDFDPSFSEIIDCSKITIAKMATSDIKELSRRPNIFNPTALHVIVAPQDHVFGLARMGQAFADKTVPNIVVVRTMEEACKLVAAEQFGAE